MSKKIKIISLITASTLVVATSIVTPLLLTKNTTDKGNDSLHSDTYTVELPDGGTKDVELYNPAEDNAFFDTSNGINFAAEKRANQVRVGWQSEYIPTDWDAIFDFDYEWDYAYKYGWTIDKYQQYISRHYDKLGPEYNIFGKNNYDIGNWIGWHFDRNDAPYQQQANFGKNTPESYHAGAWSEANPITWDNAWEVESNHIDNTKRWYAYDRNDTFFIWDQDNYENAWNRLVNMDRLVPTDKASIRIDDANEDGSIRNYVMLDGSLVPASSLKADGEYYYVKDEGDKYVLDDNGWKVVIEKPADFSATTGGAASGDNIFTKILNPKNALDTANLVTTGDNQSEDGVEKIDYPADYVLNTKMRPEVISTFNDSPDKALKNVNQNYRNFLRGKYTIAATADSYEHLAARPDVFFPQEDVRNRQISEYAHDLLNPDTKAVDDLFNGYANWNDLQTPLYDRFGYAQAKWEIFHPECGYQYVWIEDGNGGRKAWKNLNRILKMVRVQTNDFTTPDDQLRFYGTFSHVWTDRDQFQKSNLNSIY